LEGGRANRRALSERTVFARRLFNHIYDMRQSRSLVSFPASMGYSERSEESSVSSWKDLRFAPLPRDEEEMDSSG
jgi:hypothetical protein